MALGPNQSILFLHTSFWLQQLLDTSYFEQGGNSEQFCTTQLCSLQSRRANSSIRLPDAQGFTNPLAITSAFQGFHKKCNSCESLKCLLKRWLTLEIITPFSLKTGWNFPCGFMLLEGILDNLWLLNLRRPGEQCKCGWWMKGKVFLRNSENSYPSFPRVSVICCQSVQETFEEKYFSLGWDKPHVSEVHKQVQKGWRKKGTCMQTFLNKRATSFIK